MLHKTQLLLFIVHSLIAWMLVVGTSCSSQSEESCPDPFSLNYASSAQGIAYCVYPETDVELTFISDLPNLVRETSGLARTIDGHLLTHNDKGGKNELYLLSDEGEHVKTFNISGAMNRDWEELASSDSIVFICDVGNNDGNRRDLQIYMVDKASLTKGSAATTLPVLGIIRFHYPEQQDFTANKNHNFDCEGVVYHSGHLYLFTKNRADKNTVLYRLPAASGTYAAEKIGEMRSGVKITGADIRADGKEILLIGYDKKKDCVVWRLSEFPEDKFLDGKKELLRLGSFVLLGQMEAIVYRTDSSVFISSERLNDLPPRLYSLLLP